jgi:hypothetical protein
VFPLNPAEIELVAGDPAGFKVVFIPPAPIGDCADLEFNSSTLVQQHRHKTHRKIVL